MHNSNITAPQRTETQAFFATVALFRDVPANELQKLAALATIETFEAGALILLEGEATNDLLVIGSGIVEVYVSRAGEKIPITTLGATAYFGDMSVFDDYPRSAYVRAVSDVMVYRFDRDSFRAFLKMHPATLYQMCTVFSHRLRNTNSALAKH
jgi:CRP-like cAMP-binding protein